MHQSFVCTSNNYNHTSISLEEIIGHNYVLTNSTNETINYMKLYYFM